MAAQTTKKRQKARSSGNGRSASQKPEKYRFAQNVGGDETVAEREYRSYATAGETPEDADVLIDVPVVKVDSIHLKVADLDAHVALQAKVLDLVNLNVGADVHLGKVELNIKGVEAQALVKVRLDHVAAIVDRVMTTLDRNPELIKSLGEAVEDIGGGAGDALGETGEAVENVGEGAEGALGDVGEGAGQALGEVGEGAGQAVGQVGEGAGQAVGQVGEGAGQAVGNLDQLVGGAGQAVGQLGQGAGQAAGGLGQAAGGLGDAAGGVGQAAGQAAGGLGQAVGGAAGGGGEGGGGSEGGLDPDGLSSGQVAKVAATTVAKEIGSAASAEAKELGLAATRKVKELGEHRRAKQAEKRNATPAALEAAKEMGVDLDEIEGSGAEGRITVRDVRRMH
jgi:pyruvate/2-oxoglutarate dehydrogenase complex dihydrolipoamide acyltransferase (E2) component